MSRKFTFCRITLAACFILLATVVMLWLVKSGSRPSTTQPASAQSPAASSEGIARAHDGNIPPAPGPTGSESADSDSLSSIDPARNPAPQPLVPVANGGGGKREISTRELAAKGKTIVNILRDADMGDPEVRASKVAEIRLLEESQHQAVLAKANQLGIPLRIDGPGHKVSILYDFRGDEPIYRTTQNKNAAITSGANLVIPAPYSLTGSGIKVGIWDAGSVRSTHQELTGRVTKKNSSAAVDDHATHVAGTIGASGAQVNAKGMAPQAMIDSYDWNSDYSEMTAAGAATVGDTTRIPLSNHSYGYDAVTSDMGQYEAEANSVDAIAASLPYYLPFWAAGNEQDVLTANGGYQSITFNGLAKNIMTIGAVDDAVSGGIRTPSLGVIASFSSLGPCDDGRIKPDVVANGVGLYSSVSTGNTVYDTYNGTSMATPSAVGSSALLGQLYAREFSGQRMRASTLKGLLIHTADDIGTAGPDYKYGWGLINVKAASDLILAHKSSLAAPKMIEGTVTNANKTQTHTFTWDGVSPIRATVCWTEPAGTIQTVTDSRTANLKHNLDAKITAPDTTTHYQPYVMPFVGTWTQASMALPATTGKNNVDTVEQVNLATPSQPGTYTVTVSLDGTLTTSSQTYSLIISGGAEVLSNPPPAVVLTSPSTGAGFLPGAPVTITATATDQALGGGPGVVSQVEFFNGATSLGVATSAPYSINWTPLTSGTFSLTARATDSENAVTNSTSVSITVLTGDGGPIISSFTPTSAAVGSLVILTGLNFVDVSAVKFNGVDAVFTVDSAGQITVTVPPTATSGTISVVNSYGTGTSSSSFTPQLPPVLISQIYGAGGNTGATYRQDYVELYNRSASPVSLTGWSVQYASSSGSTWSVAPLSGTIAPGRYYLLGLAGGTPGLAIPTPDATGTSAMSATTGKVALTSSTTALLGTSPVGAAGLQDFVGFGTANAYEGAVAPSPSTTRSIFRAGAGATDTGNNSADFTAAAPSPRNSSYTTVLPVITSATTATGSVGTPFVYQITASNVPTSYAATGLPDGLIVNTSTGAITGTPTATGTSSATISATNSAGPGSATLTLTINPGSGGGGPVTLFSENMGTPSGTTTIAANAFQNSGLTFSGTGDVRSTSPSSGYTGASGSRNILITNSVSTNFVIAGINTTGYSGLSLTLGHLKTTSASNNELVVEVSPDGTTYTPLTYSRPTGSGTAVWLKISPTGTIPATANLRIRFRQTSNSPQFRIDDVILTGTQNVIATPTITATGTLAAVSTTYGTASPSPASFTVSGADMAAGILVTPPAGFEVSLAAGSGYAASLTISGTGTIANTTIYLRLASTNSAGFYSGDVVCTSAGAVPASLPTTTSEVRLKLLTITADSLTKSAGTTLTLGTGQTTFASSGLVGVETIGSVTLTASGGTAAGDPAGIYSLTPSAATGGTFSPTNYDLNYIAGVLTVTGATLADWLEDYDVGSLTALRDDPDHDGLPNGIENILGTAPDATTPGLTLVSATGSTLVFRHSRSNSIAGDLTASYEWSSNLVNWRSSGTTDGDTTVTIAAATVIDTSAPDNDLVEVTATLAGTPEPQIFVRLKAMKP